MFDAWMLLPLLTLVGGLCALAPLGAQVLARGVVFTDLAVAQAAAASTLWFQLIHHTHAPGILMVVSVLGALASAAAVAWLCQAWPSRREALIGLLYVVGAMLGLLAAQYSPHGREDLQELLAADLLWSDEISALVAIGSGVLTLLLHAFGRALLARDMIFFSVFGLVISLMVQALGVFLVFALLIAPAVMHERFGLIRTIVFMLAANLIGLAVSWHFDLPSGICLTLCISLAGLGTVAFRQPSA